jgi:hypothetical protein
LSTEKLALLKIPSLANIREVEDMEEYSPDDRNRKFFFGKNANETEIKKDHKMSNK